MASSASAKAAVTATIKPVKVGRPVVLEQLDGTSWKKVGKAKQDKAGRAEFAALVSKSGLPLTYRVEAAKFKGLGKVTSSTASTDKWVTPSWTDEFSGTTLDPQWHHRGRTYERESLRMCRTAATVRPATITPKLTRITTGSAPVSLRGACATGGVASPVTCRVSGAGGVGELLGVGVCEGGRFCAIHCRTLPRGLVSEIRTSSSTAARTSRIPYP